jgi:hypothetical protein
MSTPNTACARAPRPVGVGARRPRVRPRDRPAPAIPVPRARDAGRGPCPGRRYLIAKQHACCWRVSLVVARAGLRLPVPDAPGLRGGRHRGRRGRQGRQARRARAWRDGGSLRPRPAVTPPRALALLVPLAAWACWAPLGAKYATVSWCLVACAMALAGPSKLRTVLAAAPGCAAAAALWAWLALSLAWTAAPLPAALIATVCGQYALPAAAGDHRRRRLSAERRPSRALTHFAAASSVAAVVLRARSCCVGCRRRPCCGTPPCDAEGNQRIASSVQCWPWGAVLALWLAAQAMRPRVRAAWSASALLLCTWSARAAGPPQRHAAAAACCLLVVGVVTSRRRVSRQRPGRCWRWRSSLAGGSLAHGSASRPAALRRRPARAARVPGRRPGRHELGAAAAHVAAHHRRWWPNVRWLGHGVGSWKLRWTERVTPRHAALAGQLHAAQRVPAAGAAGRSSLAPLLWLVWLGAGMAPGCGGPALRGVPACAGAGGEWPGPGSSMPCCGTRSSHLPLLLLAALGAAAARDDTNPPSGASG